VQHVPGMQNQIGIYQVGLRRCGQPSPHGPIVATKMSIGEHDHLHRRA
jgi:hypothetical protein